MHAAVQQIHTDDFSALKEKDLGGRPGQNRTKKARNAAVHLNPKATTAAFAHGCTFR